MSVNALVVYCVTFVVVVVGYQASPVNGLVCHCMVGLDDPDDIEPCDSVTKTRTCAPGGVCIVGTAGGRDVQRCIYNQFTIRTCPNSNTHLCCEVDLCNGFDNFTEFLASQTNNDRSSTNIAPSSTNIPASSTSSMTNLVITSSTVAVNATPTVNVSAESSSSDSSPPPYAIALIVVLSFIILVVAVIIIIILSLYCLSWYRNGKQPIKDTGSMGTFDVSTEDITNSTTDWSAGSGSGLPVLFQAHIARQITREHLIGRGRYGQVWRGYYKGEDVAVKVFQSIEETSWLHEVDIYHKCGLRHPNILRFIAADRSDAGMFIENWLIAEYCENGNLYDYLQCYVLAEATVVAMAHDIASGLVFIHSVITGTEGKASIAHRDLKSRNILVKKDLSLVIGDFGLAIRHDINNDMVEEPPTQRVGTKRYLAPEILDGTMNMNIFDSFKRADIYSFGLVLWEIVRRGQCDGVVEEPQLPYYDCVPSDPSFEEMQNVVCVEQRRPLIPTRWHQSPVFSGLAKLMSECWHHSGEARLKALRVRRRLEELDTLCKNCDKNDSPKSTAKPS